MQIGRRRIPFRILKRIEMLMYILFPAAAGLAIYLGISRQHAAFYVAAAIAVLYEAFMYLLTSQHVNLRYALVVHTIVFLIISAVYVVAFEYYVVGTASLTVLGFVLGIYLVRIALGDATYRETHGNINGNAV